MVKTLKSLLLLLLTCSLWLHASEYTATLKKYDEQIKFADEDELLRIHHSLKSIYIKSIVSNDIELKKDVLERLVSSASKLSLDADNYKRELQTLIKTPKNNNKVQVQAPIVKPKPPKKPKAPKIEKPKEEPLNKVIVAKDKSLLPRLKSIENKSAYLSLIFEEEIPQSSINRFVLQSKGSYREVFDIKAVLPFTPKIRTPESLKDFRIAQYNAKKLRLVFERDFAHTSRAVTKNNEVRIYYSKAKTQQIQKSYINVATNKIIVIDAGHGGKDAGAVGSSKHLEKHAVLKIALKIGSILKTRGYKVYYTRTKDKFIKLRDRTKYANKKNADLFLSIHANAADKKSLHGIETFFLSPARSKRSKNVAALENQSDIEEMNYFSKQTFLNVFNREKIIQANKLALDVQQGMLNRVRSKYSSVRDGGVREAPFWVLVGAQMPAILIETGYITNAKERVRIFNNHYQNLLAQGVADGIESYFIKN